MREPCRNRTTLFEPYLLPEETYDQRSLRISSAQEICKACPLKIKQVCAGLAQEGDLTRGVWGGKVITANDLGEKNAI